MPEPTGRIAPATAVKPQISEPERPIQRKRGLRIALVSLASVIVLLGGVAVGGFAYLNHVVGSIPRIPVKFTTMDAAANVGGMTVLLTSYQAGYTGTSSVADNTRQTGMIMLLHLNADQKAGGAVSIPPQTLVRVPGHGSMELYKVLTTGGASLLAETVQSATHVRINHYVRVDFSDVAATVNALGGVSVVLPEAQDAFGHDFPAGVDRLGGKAAVAYTRDDSLTEYGRVQRQQDLLRAIVTKLTVDHLLTNPVTAIRVLKSFTTALTFDSTFSNAQIESLATNLGALKPGSSTYVTAATTTTDGVTTLNPTIDGPLWEAVNQDSLAAFAKRYPATITPTAAN